MITGKNSLLEAQTTQISHRVGVTKITCNGGQSSCDWHALSNLVEDLGHAKFSTILRSDFEVTMGSSTLGVNLPLRLSGTISQEVRSKTDKTPTTRSRTKCAICSILITWSVICS